jgi:hypothetical protein
MSITLAPSLASVPTPSTAKRSGKPRAVTTRVVAPDADVGILRQIRIAGDRRNRVAMALGAARGAWVPIGVCVVAHRDLDLAGVIAGRVGLDAWHVLLLALVLGGLAYSLPTVVRWGRLFGDSKIGAIGFAVLTEGVMCLSGQAWLAGAALVMLCVINAVASGVSLVRGAPRCV